MDISNFRLYRANSVARGVHNRIYRMSGVISGRLPGQLVKCDTCHHYQVINPRRPPPVSPLTGRGDRDRYLSRSPRTGLDQAMPRLPLPSAGCCICLRALRKTLSKQLQQQQVDFMLSEPDEQQRSLMKRPSSVNSSSGFTLVAELEQLPADSHVMTLDYSPGDDY